MSNLIDSAKGIVAGMSDAASAAAREAAREIDKRIRIAGIESQVHEAHKIIDKNYEEIGKHMVALYRSDAKSLPADVITWCEQIISLELQISDKQGEIDKIKAEVVPTQQVAPVAAPVAAVTPPVEVHVTPVAPTPNPPLTPPDPVVAEAPVNVPAPLVTQCPKCGASIRAGARFCVACGNKLT